MEIFERWDSAFHYIALSSSDSQTVKHFHCLAQLGILDSAACLGDNVDVNKSVSKSCRIGFTPQAAKQLPTLLWSGAVARLLWVG